MNKKTIVPYILMIISAIMMASVFFLPFYQTVGYEGPLGEHRLIESVVDPEIFWGFETIGRWMNIFIFMTAVFVFVNFLGAILKKPIMLLVFTPLAFVALLIFSMPFYEMGIGSASSFVEWGYGYYAFNIGAFVSFVSAILMLALRNSRT